MDNTIIFEKTPLRCALMKLCVMHTVKTDSFFRKIRMYGYDGFRSSVDGFNHGRFMEYSPQGWPDAIFISATDGNHSIFMEHLKTMHSRIKKYHTLTNEMEF